MNYNRSNSINDNEQFNKGLANSIKKIIDILKQNQNKQDYLNPSNKLPDTKNNKWFYNISENDLSKELTILLQELYLGNITLIGNIIELTLPSREAFMISVEKILEY